jgi:predicted GIY-YIG superfamily endonuclease
VCEQCDRREKQIQAVEARKKVALIEEENPTLEDLSAGLE